MDLAFVWGPARGRLRAGGADAVEEDGGGFVVGVLGQQFRHSNKAESDKPLRIPGTIPQM